MAPTRSPVPVGRNPDSPEWCHVCCTRHTVAAECPGDTQATGPERFGWKVFVETPFSTDAYGVLVGPVGTMWRARILTYPDNLWTVPGGKGAMKFLARTPQAAEEQAIRFVEEYCAARKYLPRSGLELATNLPAKRLQTTALVPRVVAPMRWPLIVPVNYALADMLAKAVTRNVSESGLFIQTPSPTKSGADVRFEMMIHATPIPLRGVVVWIRRNADIGRPPGMGIKLVLPSRAYLSFIRSLPPPKPAEGFSR